MFIYLFILRCVSSERVDISLVRGSNLHQCTRTWRHQATYWRKITSFQPTHARWSWPKAVSSRKMLLFSLVCVDSNIVVSVILTRVIATLFFFRRGTLFPPINRGHITGVWEGEGVLFCPPTNFAFQVSLPQTFTLTSFPFRAILGMVDQETPHLQCIQRDEESWMGIYSLCR